MVPLPAFAGTRFTFFRLRSRQVSRLCSAGRHPVERQACIFPVSAVRRPADKHPTMPAEHVKWNVVNQIFELLNLCQIQASKIELFLNRSF